MSDAVVFYLTCPGGKSELRLLKGRELAVGRSLLGGDPQAAERHCLLSCDLSGAVSVTSLTSHQDTVLRSAAGPQSRLAKDQTRTFLPGDTLHCGQSHLTLAPPSHPAPPSPPPPRSTQAPPPSTEALQRQLHGLKEQNQELRTAIDQMKEKLSDSAEDVTALGAQLKDERERTKVLTERLASNAALMDTLQQVNTALRDQPAAATLAAERAELQEMKRSTRKLADDRQGPPRPESASCGSARCPPASIAA